MTYAATKFEVARSNGLGGDTFTRNVTDARSGFGKKFIYPFFSKEKVGIKIKKVASHFADISCVSEVKLCFRNEQIPYLKCPFFLNKKIFKCSFQHSVTL